jgi:uncharacterized membrane protein YkvA (DUF1232 family)
MPMRDLARLFPDLLRLLRGLAREPGVPRTVRWRLLFALAYDAQPFNLIPDFIPVVGLLDNVVVTAWAVRSAVRRSGRATVASYWRGSEEGFELLCQLCRVDLPGTTPEGGC